MPPEGNCSPLARSYPSAPYTPIQLPCVVLSVLMKLAVALLRFRGSSAYRGIYSVGGGDELRASGIQCGAKDVHAAIATSEGVISGSVGDGSVLVKVTVPK